MIAIRFLVLVLLALGACSGGRNSEQLEQGETLVLGMIADIQVLDPHRQTGNPTNQVLSLITESLVQLDENGAMAPGLAEHWTVNEDATEHTFFLRKGVRFHNGREMVAEDVKQSYEHMADPATRSPKESNFRMIDHIQVLDRHTVRFHLNIAYAGFGSNYFGGNAPIIPPESFDQSQPIGTGPFEFVEWRPRQHLKVRRFPNYWIEGLPHVEEVIFKPVVDDTVRYTGLLAGDLDFVFSLPFSVVPQWLESPPPNIVPAIKPGSRSLYISLHTRRGPLQDRRVRQAIAHALDKQAIIEGICWGLSRPEAQPYPPGSPWYFPDLEDPYRQPDLERSRQLLSDAGHADGISLVAIVRNETPIMHLATLAQDQLRKIGVELKIEVMDRATHLGRQRRHDFDLNPGHMGIYPDPDSLLYVFNHSQSSDNWGLYDSVEFDRTVEEARGTVDPQRRRQLYRRALEIMNQDLHFIYLGHLPVAQAWASRVKGLSTNIRGDIAYQGGGVAHLRLDR